GSAACPCFAASTRSPFWGRVFAALAVALFGRPLAIRASFLFWFSHPFFLPLYGSPDADPAPGLSSTCDEGAPGNPPPRSRILRRVCPPPPAAGRRSRTPAPRESPALSRPDSPGPAVSSRGKSSE